jgi:hypothetical protein
VKLAVKSTAICRGCRADSARLALVKAWSLTDQPSDYRSDGYGIPGCGNWLFRFLTRWPAQLNAGQWVDRHRSQENDTLEPQSWLTDMT